MLISRCFVACMLLLYLLKTLFPAETSEGRPANRDPREF